MQLRTMEIKQLCYKNNNLNAWKFSSISKHIFFYHFVKIIYYSILRKLFWSMIVECNYFYNCRRFPMVELTDFPPWLIFSCLLIPLRRQKPRGKQWWTLLISCTKMLLYIQIITQRICTEFNQFHPISREIEEELIKYWSDIQTRKIKYQLKHNVFHWKYYFSFYLMKLFWAWKFISHYYDI